MVLKLKHSKNKKIAIIHDNLFEYGGSEVVLKELINIFPNADVYTFFVNRNNAQIKETFLSKKISSSILSNYSFLRHLGKYFSVFKVISWIYFISLNLNKYDIVISSSHSYNSKIVRTKKHTKHISYIHTPND